MDASSGFTPDAPFYFLFIQAGSALLLALLSFLCNRSLHRTPLRYWAWAWLTLTLATSLLLVGYVYPEFTLVVYPGYLSGELLYVGLILAGCASYARGFQLERRHAWLLVPVLILGAALPRLCGNNVILITLPESALVAGFYAAAVVAIAPARRIRFRTPGLRLMSDVLTLLALIVGQYVPILACALAGWLELPVTYLNFVAITRLLLKILLGFAAVMLMFERIHRELETTNQNLSDARDRFETLARRDALTELLNRRAFAVVHESERRAGASGASGAVALVDLDDLKQINDSLGHSAGDEAIRTVAQALRSQTRAADLLFRWGGDEFLILAFGLAPADLRERLARLPEVLLHAGRNTTPPLPPLSVSYGICAFQPGDDLERVAEQADAGMYEAKGLRRRGLRQA